MPIRILHIGKYFPPRFGGIETFMAQLMESQAAEGLEVLAIVHNDYRNSQEEWHGCKLTHVKSYGQLAYAPVAPGFGFSLWRLIRKERPDIVHIHMPNLSAFWLLLLASFLPRFKWVVHWHADVLGSVPDLKIKLLYPLYRVFERWLLKKADKIICTSPDYLASSQPLQCYQEKCKVIPLGVDIAEQSLDIPITAGKSDDNAASLQLLMIGRLTYYKGHALLFDAVKQLVQQGLIVQLTVVGDGELAGELKALVAKLGLKQYIAMLGSVSEVQKQALLADTDLLCLPSIERTEAFGMVLLEAAIHAKPALATRVPGSGMGYVVQDNITGLLARPGQVDDLVDKLKWACYNPTKLVEMGLAAQQRLHQHFSMQVVSQQISQLYDTLLLTTKP